MEFYGIVFVLLKWECRDEYALSVNVRKYSDPHSPTLFACRPHPETEEPIPPQVVGSTICDIGIYSETAAKTVEILFNMPVVKNSLDHAINYFCHALSAKKE
jgi:hypothetical protein